VIAVTHDLGLAGRMHRRIQLMDGAITADDLAAGAPSPLAMEPSKT